RSPDLHDGAEQADPGAAKEARPVHRNLDHIIRLSPGQGAHHAQRHAVLAAVPLLEYVESHGQRASLCMSEALSSRCIAAPRAAATVISKTASGAYPAATSAWMSPSVIRYDSA